MTQRINYDRIAPEAVAALSRVNTYLQSRNVEDRLRHLLELRVSQINGCSFCMDLHSRQARHAGETQQRLDCLQAWQEVSFFSAREKAALAWAESVTLVSETRVPDLVFEQAREHFSEEQLVDLTMVVVSMNAWNRLAISFRKSPPERHGAATSA